MTNPQTTCVRCGNKTKEGQCITCHLVQPESPKEQCKRGAHSWAIKSEVVVCTNCGEVK